MDDLWVVPGLHAEDIPILEVLSPQMRIDRRSPFCIRRMDTRPDKSAISGT